jgi:hypothetical protein
MSRVTFNLDKNQTFTTYSHDEYSRDPIEHVLYRRNYKGMSDGEFYAIYVNLDLYKLYDMIVHKNSIKNTLLHVKKLNIKKNMLY